MADDTEPVPQPPQASAAPTTPQVAPTEPPQPAQPTMNLLAPSEEAIVASGGPGDNHYLVELSQPAEPPEGG